MDMSESTMMLGETQEGLEAIASELGFPLPSQTP